MPETKKTVVTTPRGTAIWPSLNTPDKKYNKYQCKLAFDADNAEIVALGEKFAAIRDAYFEELVAELKQQKKAGIIPELKKVDQLKIERDPETGDETGRVILTASMNPGGIIKNGPRAGQPWSQKPDIFSASGKQLKNPPIISGGSELKMSVEIEPYFKPADKTVGVSMRLKAVQVLKLVSGGQRSFGDYGFGAEEGDEIEDQDAPFETDTTTNSAGDGADDDL